jgi:hypothetical protein
LERVTVTPATFTMVAFDAERISALATEVAERVDLPDDVVIDIEVDETSPLGHTRALVDGRRVQVLAESGAFEDPKRLRQFSDPAARGVLGRVLFRARDRLDPAFGRPPADSDLTLEQHAAWDVYAVGRYARVDGRKDPSARRRYQFRLRHGFNDASDRVFDQLWGASNLTWADLEAACAETAAARGS